MVLRELLEEIINTEDISSQVYERIAAVNEGDIAVSALAFAKEEKHHAKAMQSIIEVVEGLEKSVPGEVELLLKMTKKEEGEPIFGLVGASRKQLFRYALQMEKESIILYEEIARYFEPDTIEKQEFDKLVKEERAHMYFILNKLHELK